MDPNHLMMVQVVKGVGVFLALLTLAIVINKALREMGEALDRRRRSFIEPAVFEHLGAASATPLRDKLPGSPSRHDRRLVEEILLESARIVKGDTRDRMTAAFEAHGSVREAILALRNRRWWRRADAAEKLGLMRSRTSVEPLVALMNDPEAEVRIRAARALGLIRGSTSIRPLVSALADPSRWSAIRVAEILINVGAEAVDDLLAAYETLPHHARVSALDVLGRIRSLRAASSEDPYARHMAVAQLEEGRVIDQFVSDLTSTDADTRAAAIRFIDKVTAAARIDDTTRQAARSAQEGVRHALSNILKTASPAPASSPGGPKGGRS